MANKFLTVYQNLFADETGMRVKEFKVAASVYATKPQALYEMLVKLSGGVTDWKPQELEAFGYVLNRDVNADILRPWDDRKRFGEGW